MTEDATQIITLLEQRFGADQFQQQKTVDGILTLWVSKENIVAVIGFCKSDLKDPFKLLYDL